MSSTDCDVLIAGGGPAGSSLAWALRDSGLEVHLFDRKRFPRDKLCAGWVTPAVFEALQIDPQDYARAATLQPLTAFHFAAIGSRGSTTRPSERPLSYGIRRREFDRYLLERVPTPVHQGAAVHSLERTREGWRVNDEIHARLVVGAGGTTCPVAQHLGAVRERHDRLVLAQAAEFEMTEEQAEACPVQGTTPEIYFCRGRVF